MGIFRKIFRRAEKAPETADNTATASETKVVDMGDDPLDPRGDGTLRAGDPLYDMIMGGRGSVLAQRREDGKWDVS